MIEVIDNFLDLKSLNNLISSTQYDQFKWEKHTVVGTKAIKDGTYKLLCDPKLNVQFVHKLFRNIYLDTENDSPFINLMIPFYANLNVQSMVSAKLNFVPVWKEVVPHGFHRDNPFNCTTAVFYLNTNDGYTLFEDGTKIESVSNRLVKFPSNMMHTGTTCTNDSGRMVLNINYF